MNDITCRVLQRLGGELQSFENLDELFPACPHCRRSTFFSSWRASVEDNIKNITLLNATPGPMPFPDEFDIQTCVTNFFLHWLSDGILSLKSPIITYLADASDEPDSEFTLTSTLCKGYAG
jgi:hypothetical protein